MQVQLNVREQEINENNAKICELTKQNNQLELDIQRYKYDRDSTRKELEGEKQLCSKLDIEIQKLHAEVQEYSIVKQEVSF